SGTNQWKEDQPRNQNAKTHRNHDRLLSRARSQRPGGGTGGGSGREKAGAKIEARPEAAANRPEAAHRAEYPCPDVAHRACERAVQPKLPHSSGPELERRPIQRL